ncbi:hypothetical protein C8R43DRAFT_1141838 [Mycena crocata]|nr:hypothetical protein C8R43DRAFT_1141838 [Mycena crocata]
MAGPSQATWLQPQPSPSATSVIRAAGNAPAQALLSPLAPIIFAPNDPAQLCPARCGTAFHTTVLFASNAIALQSTRRPAPRFRAPPPLRAFRFISPARLPRPAPPPAIPPSALPLGCTYRDPFLYLHVYIFYSHPTFRPPRLPPAPPPARLGASTRRCTFLPSLLGAARGSVYILPGCSQAPGYPPIFSPMHMIYQSRVVGNYLGTLRLHSAWSGVGVEGF